MTQAERIMEYMKTNGSITPMQAFRYLGITKLSTRIGEMIRAGEDIDKQMVSKKNRYGEKTHYMVYSLGGKHD